MMMRSRSCGRTSQSRPSAASKQGLAEGPGAGRGPGRVGSSVSVSMDGIWFDPQTGWASHAVRESAPHVYKAQLRREDTERASAERERERERDRDRDKETKTERDGETERERERERQSERERKRESEREKERE